MKKLSNSEEQLMGYLWQQNKSFLKELILSYPQPHPAKTTIATLLARLQKKEYIAYQVFGNSRQYFTLIEKEEYFSVYLKEMMDRHFNSSMQEFGNFLVQTIKPESTELDALKKVIDASVNSRQNKDAVFF